MTLVVVCGLVALFSVVMSVPTALQHDTQSIGGSFPVVCPSIYDRAVSHFKGSTLPAIDDTTGDPFGGPQKQAESVCSRLSNADNSEFVWPWVRTFLGALVLAVILYPRKHNYWRVFSRDGRAMGAGSAEMPEG
jgi:hypothetical protein